MLVELGIKNFAIISSLRLQFHDGMTALTGETGAGKSIIIDAMGLLCGSRGSTDYIRQGSNKCSLEGLFEVPTDSQFTELLHELGIETEDELLIVQRDISQSGKNICRVNGRTLTLSNLRRIGAFLVDIQGQNEHQELLQPERHLHLLDQFGGKKFQELLAKYRQAFEKFQHLKQQMRKIQANEQSYVQRMDMLRFQQDEIANANLLPNEEEELTEERAKLGNYQKIVDSLAHSYALLTNDEGNSLDGIGAALTSMQDIAHLDSEYETVSENLQSAFYLLQEAAGDISRQFDSLSFDEGRLEEVNQRLELIHQLKRKYGQTVSEVLAYYEEITKELTESAYTEGQLEQLAKEVSAQEEVASHFAEQLHQERKKIAYKLSLAIVTELKELYMEHSQFEVRFMNSKKILQEDGFDEVEFYLTTNPGEPLKPLVKVASGGELSRMLLALKTIFSQNQGITSIVFDEVDTGVSGRVAQAIAEKIAKIAANSQVLCITHLPQVAAIADYQYYIKKEINQGRTQTIVSELEPQNRVYEIARMLAGSEVTELTMEHAKELLAMAGH
ncbi:MULTISPECIES: DNA repair protein RecN [Enterococcus]|uniref:DNA repair protein RecN n=1 Tax=Enterococcus dispar ATCC 51266 TaxID=1139219 RepID=S1NN83_9ENTE|nr:DNA repair protein RecN [Enterococcus dispar]EOT41178.1 DNA repair protein RecN [Enterococcus dispar ATCC 51266]EOW87188.1 DNA repair protein RecN [Enterococcus dispar ATCC 51266]MCU7356484.1 DNA repair protein RecN [Enterococcus dispar]OJG38672.1 DNA repair protein RecN [Enterococcus dispar]WCG33768.1 DNA repair protein RecN [Enterococcus dispar]